MTDQNMNDPAQTPGLTCNRCGKPITPETAILTPTGYRCQDCIRAQQKIFDTTKPQDIVIGFLIAGVFSYVGGLVVSRLGFFTLLVAPGVGTLIANAVRVAVKRRRSKLLNSAILAGALIGGIPLLLPGIVSFFVSAGSPLSAGNLLPLIWRGVYVALVASTAFAQTKGIRL